MKLLMMRAAFGARKVRLCALVAAEGVDAHQDDGKRYVVRADEKLTAFVELERAIYDFAVDLIS
jgi:hypothetical protein